MKLRYKLLPCIIAFLLYGSFCNSCHNPWMENILSTNQDEGTEIPVHEHEWGEWMVTLEPDCTEKGERKRVCIFDETHVEIGAIDALGHNWQAGTDAYKLPTCTEEGEGSQFCTRCGDIIPEGVIPALGHNYQNWTKTADPTCEVAGVETGTCTHDNSHKDTRPIPALGHDEGAWHVTHDATCEGTGIRELRCTRDNFVLKTETMSALGHDWSGWTTTPAACETAGEEKRTCSRDATHIETKSIPALGHDWEWVVTTEPTTTTVGVETQICKHDPSHTNETRPIEKIPSYTVTFNSMGGSDVAPVTLILYGETITAPTPPVSGYGTFAGWYNNEEYTSSFNFDTNIIGDITLYAKWKITFNIGDIGPGGGIIIYKSETGFTMTDTSETCYYLEAAPNNLWVQPFKNASSNDRVNGTQNEIGAGRNNTQLIMQTHDDAWAANECVNYRNGGLDDWYLPCRSELEYLFNIGKDIEDFLIYYTGGGYDEYWASEQSSSYGDSAITCRINSSGVISTNVSKDKTYWCIVHPMRAF